jgi:hypothetical protein
MAQAPLPNGAGGYQFNDGNVGEALLFTQAAPATYAAVGTLTAADLAGGFIQYTGSTSPYLTLPTVADLEAVISSAKVNSAFNFNVLASGSGSPEIGTATGWTLVGSMTVATTTATAFRARKTGTGTWTLYRVA